MSVKKEASGRRSVHVEVEVPGTPEEVWRAIGTGAGVSCWFVPTTIEERVGGKITCNFGPGGDAVATITAWNPPHYSSAESQDMGTGAPPIASEWIVEAKSGGICVVRVVQSLFSSTDDWDEQLEGTESGWPSFFRVLKLYMTHFRGLEGKSFVALNFPQGQEASVWERFTRLLGLSAIRAGESFKTGNGGVPQMSGVVEWNGDEQRPNSLLLRLDQPAPGLAILASHTHCGQLFLSACIYLYGPSAADAISREENTWRTWFNAEFPSAAAAEAHAAE